MVLIKNKQKKFKININKIKTNIENILHLLNYQDFDINIWLTTNKTIKKYNLKYRKKNYPTDILSFPYHQIKAGEKIKALTEEDKNLGDIIISLEYSVHKAKEFDKTFEQYLKILIAHGIAHLLGYDHQTDTEYKKMQKFEQKLLI